MFLLCKSKIWSSHFDCFASPVVLNNVNGLTDSLIHTKQSTLVQHVGENTSIYTGNLSRLQCPSQHNKVAKNIKYMTEESVSYYWNWNICVNETTPKWQKEVVAKKRGFCSMTMTTNWQQGACSVRELELYKVTQNEASFTGAV